MAEKKIAVPRAEVARLLGLSPDVDNATLSRELENALGAARAQTVSAAEQEARAEDRRTVIAACNEGKLSADRIEFWCDALKKDRSGNRAVLASLAAVPLSLGQSPAAADPVVENVHNKVMARLGIKAVPQSPRAVAASADPIADHRERQVLDDLGLPIAQAPGAVTVQRGTPPEQWTEQQKQDHLQRQLGRKFWPGTKPAPAGDLVYLSSPNDPYEFDSATGQWREKPPHVRHV